MKYRISYVTDLENRPGGGGSYVVNWHAYRELSARFAASYVGPVVPRPSTLEVMVSRARRKIFGIPGRFAYFSPSTLDGNAARVTKKLDADPSAVVFRSAARWCRVKTSKPYFVYLDAVFHTFFHNTFDPADFIKADIERIFEEEAQFLENASGVFFESRWGMATARDAYSLRGSHYMATGRGGAVTPPASDEWDGQSTYLLTVAMDFHQKGGDVVAEAYRSLRASYPSLRWHIVGGAPPADVAALDGVTCEGVLDPSSQTGRARLIELLRNAFLLVHPTREDTSPLVITEAAYFGCPAVAVNAFAIPELVTNGVTGILVERAEPALIANAISELMDNRYRYRDMRRNARAHAIATSSWDAVGSRMYDTIAAVLR